MKVRKNNRYYPTHLEGDSCNDLYMNLYNHTSLKTSQKIYSVRQAVETQNLRTRSTAIESAQRSVRTFNCCTSDLQKYNVKQTNKKKHEHQSMVFTEES